MKGSNTIIGQSVKLTGDLVGDSDIIIEGVVDGTIHTNENIEITETAEVNAVVTCSNATIGGKLKGNITVKETLKINGTAIVTGDIRTTNISVDHGAVINGRLETGGVHYDNNHEE